MLEVEADRALPQVVRDAAVARHGAVAPVWRRQRGVDLRHLGAHVGEQARAVRPGDDAGDVEDTDAVEDAASGRHGDGLS